MKADDVALGEGEEYELRAPDEERLYGTSAQDLFVVAWRALDLERLGFSPVTVDALAIRKDVSMDQVRKMRAAGATPLQVAAIVL